MQTNGTMLNNLANGTHSTAEPTLPLQHVKPLHNFQCHPPSCHSSWVWWLQIMTEWIQQWLPTNDTILADEMDDSTHTPPEPALLPNYKYSFCTTGSHPLPCQCHWASQLPSAHTDNRHSIQTDRPMLANGMADGTRSSNHTLQPHNDNPICTLHHHPPNWQCQSCDKDFCTPSELMSWLKQIDAQCELLKMLLAQLLNTTDHPELNHQTSLLPTQWSLSAPMTHFTERSNNWLFTPSPLPSNIPPFVCHSCCPLLWVASTFSHPLAPHCPY